MDELLAPGQEAERTVPSDVAPALPLASVSPIQAVQHIRRMRGGAQAHLMRASDDYSYVVKFMNNPQHVRVLANEFLATRLAQKLGIPVPEPAVIEVSTWLHPAH